MRLGNIECWIEGDDGKALDEYSVDVDGTKCSAWIPSAVGKKFSIVYKDLDRSRTTGSYPCIDGISFKGRMLCKNRASDNSVQTHVRTGPTEQRRLQFGALELTDDESCLLDTQRAFGEIVVVIWRCEIAGRKPSKGYTVPGPARAHEQSKKGLAHAVTFGAPQPGRPSGNTNIVRLGGAPLATFVFRYRGMDMLRANGIAPVQLPVASDQGEVKERKRKLSEDAEPRRVRPKREAANGERARRAEDEHRQARMGIKREKCSGRVKLENNSTSVPEEVVDLTGL